MRELVARWLRRRALGTDARLITSPDAPVSGRVYLYESGRRRYVPDSDRLPHYGLRIESTTRVDADEIARIPKWGDLPYPWPRHLRRNPPADANPAMLREIACCDLAGSGVEFGAGTKRAAIPLRCSVRYADHQSAETLQARKYPGQDGDFVQLDLHSNLQTMEGYRRRQS